MGNPRGRCVDCGNYNQRLVERLCPTCKRAKHQPTPGFQPKGVKMKKCNGCGENGHLATSCPNRPYWECKKSKDHNNKGRNKKKCPHCNKRGHLSTECWHRPSRVCENCEQIAQENHECPQLQSARASCPICDESGHTLTECPRVVCPKCLKTGHTFISCADSFPVTCSKCGEAGHFSTTCPTLGPENHSSPRPQARCDTPAAHGENGPEETQSPNSNQKRQSPDAKSANTARSEEQGRQGMVAYSNEDLKRAIELLTNALRLEPRTLWFYTRGIAHARLGSFVAALADFQAAATEKSYKASTEVLIHIARCRFYIGSPSSALLAVDEALLSDPSSSGALALKNRILELERHASNFKSARTRKHWKVARTSYEECLRLYAIEYGTTPAEIQCWGVELLIAEGLWAEAKQTVDIILRNETKDTDVMALRGLVLFLKGDLSESLAQLTEVLQLDPDNQRARSLRPRVKKVDDLKAKGNSLFATCAWKEAIQHWSDAILILNMEEDSRSSILQAILLLNRAMGLEKVEKYSEGLKDANAALGLNQKYSKAYCVRARIFVALELYDSAIQDCKTVLEHISSGIHSVSQEYADRVRQDLENIEQLALVEANKPKDYYGILGVDRKCSQTDIKRAYRRQSLLHHPDKGGVEEKFKLVSEAYETLSNEHSRQSYDVSYFQGDYHVPEDWGNSDQGWAWA